MRRHRPDNQPDQREPEVQIGAVHRASNPIKWMRSDGASGALSLLDLDQPLACLSETFGRARISNARPMSMRTIVPRKAPALLWREVNLRQGSQMASQLELIARAALCRQLAKREPTNRVLWMAEAENWSRLSNEKLRGEPEQKSVTASWPVCASVPQDCLPISA